MITPIRLLAGTVLAAYSGISWADSSGSQPDVVRQFSTDVVTPGGLDVSPTGIVYVSVAGTLQRLVIAGGTTSQVSLGRDYVLEPRLSPKGDRLAYLSNAGSESSPTDDFTLWISNLAGQYPIQIGSEQLRYPSWAKSGKSVFAVNKRDVVVKVDLHGRVRSTKTIAPGGIACCLGTKLLVARNNQLDAVNLQTGGSDTVYKGKAAQLFRPAVSPDGRLVAFVEITADGMTHLRQLSRENGKVTEIYAWPMDRVPDKHINFVRAIGQAAAFSFAADNSIVFGAEGKIYKFHDGGRSEVPASFVVQRLAPRPIHPEPTKLGDWWTVKQLRWPAWSKDGKSVIVSGAGHLWKLDGLREPGRVTASEKLEYFPAIAPDGLSLAYVSVGYGGGTELRIRDLASGQERILFTAPIIARPTFSSDGRSIAFYTQNSNLSVPPRKRSENLAIAVVEISRSDPITVSSIKLPMWPTSQYYPPMTWASDGNLYVQTERISADGVPEGFLLLSIDPVSKRSKFVYDSGPQEYNFDTVTVSPSGKRAVLSRLQTLEVIELETGRSLAKLGGMAAQFVSWIDEDRLGLSSGNLLSQWRIDEPSAQPVPTSPIQMKRDKGSDTFVIRNVTILSQGPRGATPNGYVLIRNGRIAEVGVEPAGGVLSRIRQIDGKGRFIMPGFIDTHTHLHYSNHGDPDLQAANDANYGLSLAYGVTTIFDPAAMSSFVFAKSELLEAGLLRGPRVFSTGWAIVGLRGPEQFRILSFEDARVIARSWKAQGAWMLKSYDLPRDKRRWLVAAADEVGLAVTVEGNAIVNDGMLFEDGMSAFEHRPGSDGRTDLQKFIASTGVRLTPTLWVGAEEWYIRQRFGSPFRSDPRTLRFLTPARISDLLDWPSTEVQGDGRLSQAEDVAALAELGAEVSVGAHGTAIQTHMEMWAMAAGGMSNADVLKAATLNGARKLGLENELGSIEVGKLADLVILNRDPRKDITATKDISLVVARGRIIDPWAADTAN